MSFDLPSDTILPVADVTVRLDPSPHPFAQAHAAAIDENWQRETEANPALFNGEVALLSSLSLSDGQLAGRCHIVPYSAFLYWRRLRPVGGAGHVYTHAMLVSADNALIAIRMGAQTVNAGLVYFAAGSFEPADFQGGQADLEFNMHREVGEETGIDLKRFPHEAQYHVLSKTTGTVLFRRYFLDRQADEIAADIRSHVQADPDPEIEGPVVIRSADDLPDRLAAQMPDLIAWHFSTPRA